ncbi:hypothetical protein CYLTODRAFT_422815 [Cylindrobasidium torrendii FP15055 ss-10]|uniref:Uncharacterized protein n=1 Tax=Cylindrobasidium torrendii FP15055 ss-10 TaxID=1314674 RepID=A0A0D7B954_9AGAR|nr:hypothetical protein CYLTODRAFT_422815 [Cylindrobasidium torrendii FP15055 ss-10]
MSLRRTHSYVSIADLPTRQSNTGALYITANKELRDSVEQSIAAYLRPITHPAPLRRSRSQTHNLAGLAASPIQPLHHQLCQPRPKPRRFPREPDLHRQAIQRCMRATSEGQKILNMGPRLAVNILTATQDLERMLHDENVDPTPCEDIIMEDCDAVCV